MTNNNLTTSNGKKLYLATFEFISGEYEQSFHRLLYAKNAEDLDTQVRNYLKNITKLGIHQNLTMMFIIIGMVKSQLSIVTVKKSQTLSK